MACAGGYAASGGSDDLIRVYHCDDRGAMADLGMCVGHRGDVRALTFYSPRGYAPTRLLSGGADGELMVWDATDNFDQLKTMRAHRGGVCSISAHASGRVALTSGADSHVAMWDMKKGRVAYKCKTPDIVDKLMFTSDGARYVSQTTKKITLTDAEAGNVISTFATPAKALCSETRGSMVYVGCEGGDVLDPADAAHRRFDPLGHLGFQFGRRGARLGDDDDGARKIDVGIALDPHHEEGDDARHRQTEEHDERRDRVPDGPGRDILEVHPLSPFRFDPTATVRSQPMLRSR